MAIAEASLDVNRCAKVLAKECTDRRIRSVSVHYLYTISVARSLNAMVLISLVCELIDNEASSGN